MGIFRDRFERPQQFYEQLDPQQQQVVGQQFQQEFAQLQDPYAQQQDDEEV
jgi:Spy/CpxP family protein refolding chaperone